MIEQYKLAKTTILRHYSVGNGKEIVVELTVPNGKVEEYRAKLEEAVKVLKNDKL